MFAAAPVLNREPRTAKSRAHPPAAVRRATAEPSVALQRKAEIPVSDPADASEREADAIADRVMTMRAPSAIQRKCASCEDDKNKIHAKRDSAAAPQPSAAASVGAVLQDPGAPLDAAARAYFEPRFGQDFSAVRVHTGGGAADAARSVDARAYTFGRDIVFGRGQYAPHDVDGRRLLAHELAHTVQQADGAPALGLSGVRAHAIVQRQYSSHAATQSDPNALIPIADFIRYVETVERAFPSDTPAEIVTRIRTESYHGLAFEHLIPDAHYDEPLPAYMQSPAGGGSTLRRPRNLRSMEFAGDAATRSAYQHLTAHADENAIQDNPSPYVVMPDGSRIDAGHMLLGLDSLLHPATSAPFTVYDIPAIDPASWVADLALASYWTSYHDRNGHPADDAAVKPASSDFNTYYNASAPNEDLLGDADSFGTKQQWSAAGSQPLSQVLRAYYLGTAGTAAGVDRRWRTFCAANGLGYAVSGGAVTWGTSVIDAFWVPRIDRMCDLSASGMWGALGNTIISPVHDPGHGTWPYSTRALHQFLDWLKPRLEAEIAAHP
jgi:Domain of unknown function (DUF4157)